MPIHLNPKDLIGLKVEEVYTNLKRLGVPFVMNGCISAGRGNKIINIVHRDGVVTDAQ